MQAYEPTDPTHVRGRDHRRPLSDPFADDAAGDAAVATTERRLQRLAIVAAETGRRFARERLPIDPAVWLMTPRELFGGRNAVDACQEREGFLRATLLHRLDLGLDARACDIDHLLQDDDDQGDTACADQTPETWRPASAVSAPGPALFTCSINARLACGHVHAFCAMVASSEDEVRERLAARYGARRVQAVEIGRGFDLRDPLAAMVVSRGMADLLTLAEADPGSPLVSGLDVQLEQRFAL